MIPHWHSSTPYKVMMCYIHVDVYMYCLPTTLLVHVYSSYTYNLYKERLLPFRVFKNRWAIPCYKLDDGYVLQSFAWLEALKRVSQSIFKEWQGWMTPQSGSKPNGVEREITLFGPSSLNCVDNNAYFTFILFLLRIKISHNKKVCKIQYKIIKLYWFYEFIFKFY